MCHAPSLTVAWGLAFDAPVLPLLLWLRLDRDDFTREQAEAFVEEAIALAMSSDSSSGGCIRLVTVDKDGAHHKYINGSQVCAGSLCRCHGWGETCGYVNVCAKGH